MTYSSTETEYNVLYTQLQRDAPKEVVKYVSENWHPIKDKWVMGLKASCGSFMNTTNNIVSAVNFTVGKNVFLLLKVLVMF